nr:hypothetical protein CFP56_09654 [Quercus suber]
MPDDGKDMQNVGNPQQRWNAVRSLRGLVAEALKALWMSSVEKESLRGSWTALEGIGMVSAITWCEEWALVWLWTRRHQKWDLLALPLGERVTLTPAVPVRTTATTALAGGTILQYNVSLNRLGGRRMGREASVLPPDGRDTWGESMPSIQPVVQYSIASGGRWKRSPGRDELCRLCMYSIALGGKRLSPLLPKRPWHPRTAAASHHCTVLRRRSCSLPLEEVDGWGGRRGARPGNSNDPGQIPALLFLWRTHAADNEPRDGQSVPLALPADGAGGSAVNDLTAPVADGESRQVCGENMENQCTVQCMYLEYSMYMVDVWIGAGDDLLYTAMAALSPSMFCASLGRDVNAPWTPWFGILFEGSPRGTARRSVLRFSKSSVWSQALAPAGVDMGSSTDRQTDDVRASIMILPPLTMYVPSAMVTTSCSRGIQSSGKL